MFRTLIVCLSLWFTTNSFSQEYKSAREARAEAAKHLNSRNFAAAQAPLEAALKLTPASDTKERVDLYRALMAPYRQLGEPDKMIEAVEYILAHGDSQAGRSLVATDFASFMHQRGKTDQAIARYEERLKQDAKDPAALAILAVVYSNLRPDKKSRGDELKQSLSELNKEMARAKAEKLAVAADTAPEAAASNWKDVAKAWLEAGDAKQARVAIDRSRAATPESRSTILTMFWHEGVGDVLEELGEREDAMKEFEAAIAAAPGEVIKKRIREKLEKLRSDKK